MKKLFALFLCSLFTVIILISCERQEERTYTEAQAQMNKDNATKLWNGGDLSIVDTLYSQNCIYHNSDIADLKGLAKIKDFVKWVYTAYPDFTIMLSEPMKLKDRIVFTFNATGTNNGPLDENMPATGKKMSFTGVSISEINNGKITEEWIYYNQVPIYKQLGYKLVLEEEKAKEKKK
jgi:steroid delta-isomerase-like uncharacterized protein